ncbi:MAG: hypothetical protein A4E58_01986 [Syntrophorhabdus sp. PtaB.Bin006]|nr:MAG: hypothetical protein A4E58_01986 [Syntrophorhabdus sp. PtaB.Bin006]
MYAAVFEFAVVVQNNNIRAPSQTNTQIVPGSKTQIPARLDQLHLRIPFSDDVVRAILGTVIHHDNLDIRIILRKDTANTCFNELSAVIV